MSFLQIYKKACTNVGPLRFRGGKGLQPSKVKNHY